MRVKYIRKNAKGLELSLNAQDLYIDMYDRHGPRDNKNFVRKALEWGYESTVYAMVIRHGIAVYYLRHPLYGDITHFPAICFDVIDSRISKYWHYERTLIPEGNSFFPREPFERSVFAIEEWIKESSFLLNYVEMEDREVDIMHKMAKLMDEEFLTE